MMNSKFSKYTFLVGLIMVLALPAYHKFTDATPPGWFLSKFQGSMIDLFPYSLNLAFIIILLLEVAAPLLLILGIVNREIEKGQYKLITVGLQLTLVLFVILTFGKFLGTRL